jgi:hypothetical protein
LEFWSVTASASEVMHRLARRGGRPALKTPEAAPNAARDQVAIMPARGAADLSGGVLGCRIQSD